MPSLGTLIGQDHRYRHSNGEQCTGSDVPADIELDRPGRRFRSNLQDFQDVYPAGHDIEASCQ